MRHQRRTDGEAVGWADDRPSHATDGNHGRYGVIMQLRGAPYDGVRSSVKRRMTFGNSFVSIVEFTADGPRARSVMAYGNSIRPDSPHWDDQAALFAAGRLKPVPFSLRDVRSQAVERYRPGDRTRAP